MNATLRIVLLVLAIVFAAVFTAAGFEWWLVDHPLGWLGLALVFGYTSRLP